MAVYTHLSDDDIQSLLNGYGLGTLESAKAIAEGVENSNYLLRAKRDGSTTSYILTIYEKRVNIDDLPFFLGMMEHLHAAGIPCPLPLKREGGECLADIHGKKAAIITFLEGKSTRHITNAHVRELGAMLAKMHLGANGFPLSRANDLSLEGWETLIGKIGDRADEVRPGLTDLITNELEYLQQHWPEGLPHGVIHADLFPDNVFFQDTSLSGVIDFYFACHDWFMYDLAIVINAWCFEKHKEFNVTKAAALLNAYHQIRPISEEELNALPVLCRGAALRFLLTRTHDWVFHVADALVQPHDPSEYVHKLNFHQQVNHHGEYGL